MENNIEFKFINNFVCKRCGCTNYDKKIYTGIKTLDNENSIIEERYVCRNCDYVFFIEDYINDNSNMDIIKMTGTELLNNSNFTDEGTEMKINNNTYKEESKTHE